MPVPPICGTAFEQALPQSEFSHIAQDSVHQDSAPLSDGIPSMFKLKDNIIRIGSCNMEGVDKPLLAAMFIPRGEVHKSFSETGRPEYRYQAIFTSPGQPEQKFDVLAKVALNAHLESLTAKSSSGHVFKLMFKSARSRVANGTARFFKPNGQGVDKTPPHSNVKGKLKLDFNFDRTALASLPAEVLGIIIDDSVVNCGPRATPPPRHVLDLRRANSKLKNFVDARLADEQVFALTNGPKLKEYGFGMKEVYATAELDDASRSFVVENVATLSKAGVNPWVIIQASKNPDSRDYILKNIEFYRRDAQRKAAMNGNDF